MAATLDESWTPAPHLMLLSRVIHRAALAREGIGDPVRAIVAIPPRHGKSTVLSKWGPTWYLENFPRRNVMLACYESDFAASWGRSVRNTLIEFQERLNVRIAPDSSAANRWNTNRGGGMITAGPGGSFTGRGADLLLVDDPIKNAMDAQSEVKRKHIWEFWESTLRTRLEPRASAIVTMTRWHRDDLVGRLLDHAENKGGEKWELINFPAVAEENEPAQPEYGIPGRKIGEALWPERYTADDLDTIRRGVGSRVWAALYQQRPMPAEGGLFQFDWFERVKPEDVPKCDKLWRYWDLAGTSEANENPDDPDYAVGTLIGYSRAFKTFYVFDVQRTRGTPLEVELLVQKTAYRDGPKIPVAIEQEPGSAGVAVVGHYIRNVFPPKFEVKGVPPTGDKYARAIPFSAACQDRRVKLVESGWNIAKWLDELCEFPNGTHDDQVDSAVGSFTEVDETPNPFTAEAFKKFFGKN